MLTAEPRISFELEVEAKRRSPQPWWNRGVDWGQFAGKLDARVKYDGSLRNGREYASRTPRTLAEWRTWNLTDVLETMQDVTSADRTQTAGLHLHIDRSAFSGSGLARLFTIVNHPDQAVMRLSRRTRFNYCYFDQHRDATHWSNFAEDGLKPVQERKQRHNKYTAVHCHPTYPTVELRFFRSTIIPARFYAALETVHALWAYSERFPELPATGTDWARWVSKHINYNLLGQELKSRKVSLKATTV